MDVGRDEEPIPDEIKKWIDRVAYYDGRLSALEAAGVALKRVTDVMDALGPVPTRATGEAVVNPFLIQTALALGPAFTRLSADIAALTAEAKDERELLLKDRAMLGGEPLH